MVPLLYRMEPIDETNISTQQEKAQKKIWISGTDENHARKKGDQPKKTRRQKKAFRLVKREEFRRLQSQGEKRVGRLLCLEFLREDSFRFGMSPSKKFGIAPQRNRFKRLVREVFRKHKKDLPPYALNVIPRSLAKNASFMQIEAEILQLLPSAKC